MIARLSQFNKRKLDSPSVSKVIILIGLRVPRLLPALAWLFARLSLSRRSPPPFDNHVAKSALGRVERLLPPRPLEETRSVLFVHNSYYHFLYLAQALRKRGWDAAVVSIDDHNAASAKFFHGEDVNLFSQNWQEYQHRLYDLRRVILHRFRMVHFSGMHLMSLFPQNFGSGINPGIPWDILEFKGAGIKLGYTISGCYDGIKQSEFRRHTGVCNKCVWEFYPEVCSDHRNGAWADNLTRMCDLIACEEDYALGYRMSERAFREPLTMALNPEIWNPHLDVPPSMRLDKERDEILVLHGFGNKVERTRHGRDIKGSGAINAAVERLRSEGHKVRLIAPIDVPSKDMRFLQVQADIVVDQLNYGRYGAQARESMMLGKPTICHIDPRQGEGVPSLRCLAECPLVEADENSIYFVLKRLISSPQERYRIGQLSRAYAMKWHSADACADRFEKVYDRIVEGLPPEADDIFADDTEAVNWYPPVEAVMACKRS